MSDGFKDSNTRVVRSSTPNMRMSDATAPVQQVSIDTLQPPWNTRTRLDITIKGNVDITTLLSFLSKIQAGAPAMLLGVLDPVKDGNATLID